MAEKSSTDTAYEPEAGDLVWIDFDPRTGREQGGRRPALVVSGAEFWRMSRFAVVCPITSRVRPFGSSVVLPEDGAISGEVLLGQIRSLETLARPLISSGAKASAETMTEVRGKLAALLQIG